EARSVMWSLVCDSETNGRRFVSLNVAGINVLSWSNGEARVAIDTDRDLSSTFRGLIREHRTDRTYGSERLIEIRACVEAMRQGESDIRRAFDSTLQKYADLGWKRNQRANEHRDDWRVKLAMIAGFGISAPAYADGNRMGLPAMSQERLASDLDTENRELAGT